MIFTAGPGYSRTNALTCVEQCRLSYESATVDDKISCTQALVSNLGEVIVIAFRGSSSLEDWLTDAKFRMEPVESGSRLRVHRGFLYCVNSVWHALLKQLCGMDRVKPLMITGHSLGGALAILCAWRLAQDPVFGPRIHSVYTFGQPRVGNKHFARHYNELNPIDTVRPPSEWLPLRQRTFRFILGEDIVPRVPGYLLGYRHCGLRMFISSLSDELEIHPSLWLMALSDVSGFVRSWTLDREVTLLTHHKIQRYIERLQTV